VHGGDGDCNVLSARAGTTTHAAVLHIIIHDMSAIMDVLTIEIDLAISSNMI